MWTRLSQPLLATCCSFLDLKAHLTIFARINRNCLQAAQQGISWSGTDRYDDDEFLDQTEPNTLATLQCLVKKYRFRAGELTAPCWNSVDDGIFSRLRLIIGTSTLKTVTLDAIDNGTQEESNLLQLMVDKCSHITTLTISCSVVRYFQPLYHQLERLTLRHQQSWDRSFLAQMPNLKVLSLYSCCDHFPRRTSDPMNFPMSLTELELRSDLTDSFLLQLKPLKNLRSLSINCRGVTNIQPLETMTSIQELVLENPANPNILKPVRTLFLHHLKLDYLTHELGWFDVVSSLVTLRHLHLEFDDETFSNFSVPRESLDRLNTLVTLKELTLLGLASNNPIFTGFLRQSPIVPSLKLLDMGSCLHQNMLPLLAERETQVEVIGGALKMEGQPSLTAGLLAQLPKLKKVRRAFAWPFEQLRVLLPHIEFTANN